MEICKLDIEGLLLFRPEVFKDNRGHFFESWSKLTFNSLGLDLDFVQDNKSLSYKGVLRGLHFQNPPFAQGKLVSVIRGSVLDVAVDIRKLSPTYGKYVAVELSDRNNTLFWIPPGFAHGFVALEDNTIFSYKCSEIYNKEFEGSIIWNDKDLNIDWGLKSPIVSEKDLKAETFKTLITQF
tara:strand:- start:816 stop:1358 length:543 start_codon:yes stop_codon:yes gene_type:complete